jgi:D-alanine-D-alanine ligase
MTSSIENRTQVSSAARFGQVAVMYGGNSSEREVSLDSGNGVLAALQRRGVDAVGWDPAERSMQAFAAAGFDRVWIALHGPGGEDGALQGALQWLNVPYTGSGVMASALAMDKVKSKHLFQQAGIRTPDYFVIDCVEEVARAIGAFGFPLVFKPVGQGSSVGMSIVLEQKDVMPATDLALSFNGQALVERCVIGPELTVAVLQGEALPSIRIETPRVFYDYRAKYESDRTAYFCPGNEDPVQEKRYRELAVASFQELGCSGWGRVDFMQGPDGEPQVLEVNTVPGMTSHSLLPIAAREQGIDFDELCWRILETSVVDDVQQDSPAAVANGA